MSALGDRSEQDTYKTKSNQFPPSVTNTKHVELTLKTDAVALQAVHGLSEEVLSDSGHSGDIVLFPLNGGVDVFKDLLD